MFRTCRAAVCVLLALVMTFGAASTAFAASPQFIILDPPSETAMSITTDKSAYAWGDTILYTVEVTNVSQNVLYDVRVAPDVRHPQWFTVETGEEDCVIGTLQPQEKATVQIAVGTKNLSPQERFPVFITVLRDKLTDGFADWYSRMFKVNYPAKRYNTVRVGLFDHGINFYVYSTNVQPDTSADSPVIF